MYITMKLKIKNFIFHGNKMTRRKIENFWAKKKDSIVIYSYYRKIELIFLLVEVPSNLFDRTI